MNPRLKNLAELINQVRARIRARRALQGVAITLAVIAVSLLLVSVLANSFSSKPAVLLLLRFLPLVLGLAAGLLFIARPLRMKLSDDKVARLIEERCTLNDSLVTAVEFRDDTRGSSPAIVDRLVTDTSARTSNVKLDQVVDPRRSYAYGAASVALLLAMASAFVIGPSSLSSGFAALYATGDAAASADSMFIRVAPGTARVPRGSDQKIKATLAGFDSEIAQVFIRKVDGDNFSAQPMEPAKSEDDFQHMIFNIQDSVNYYIEAKGVRSPEFTLEVADLPYVKQLDLLLNFPSYTRAASKKIENGGEIATLKGTVVSVTAQLSAKAKGARIVLSDGTKVEMSAGNDNQFTGSFTVSGNGTYKIELTSIDGENYNGSMEFDITVLEDHAPTVMIDKPGRDMKVTSIQEVFAQVRAEDDYGVSEIELFYSVNGGEERRVKLQDIKSDSPKALSGSHTFFLEEHSLQPGDFISYYAKARDNAVSGTQESTSDIYFLEVRPFDRQFRQAQQQGGGGGEGEQDSNALTRRQREIIAATFRVQREQATYTPEEKSENFNAVTLSQEKLKSDTDSLAERIRRRLGDQLNTQPEFAKLVELLGEAAKEMVGAAGHLRATNTKDALAPEQRALQQLLRAEAIFREIQVAMGQQQGGGQSQQNSEELADLFELQLDKMKNQYETVQREQQSQQQQQQDELARRLQELARRQQQQMEQQMRSQMQQQGGGGGGGSQRQQQEMIDEARKMARELERLSRERRDQKLAEAARQMQQAADDMQRAQASQSQSSSSQNASEARAQQMRALEKMEEARRSLENSQRASGQQSVQQLKQQAEQALKRQEQIAKDVDELARQSRNGQGGQTAEEKKGQIAERKQALAEQVSGLEKDIEQAARSMGTEKQEASDKLRQAAGAIRQNRIPDRIRNNQSIEAGRFDEARERERTIRGNMEEVLKNLQAAESGAGRRNQSESLEEALNRARELADNLESLRRKSESGNQEQGAQGQQSQSREQAQNGSQSQQQGNQSQQSGQQAGRQQGQQQGQQQGRQSQGQQARGQQSQGQQPGQQQGQQQGQQPGQQQGQPSEGQQGSQSQQSQSQTQRAQAGGGPPRGGDRQLSSEIRERIAEAEDLQRMLGRNSELGRELGRAIEQLKRLNPEAFNDAAQLALLKSEVIDPLRQIEVELAKKLQAKLGNNGPGALSDGDGPDRYRKHIEEYYRRLSSRQPDAKP